MFLLLKILASGNQEINQVSSNSRPQVVCKLGGGFQHLEASEFPADWRGSPSYLLLGNSSLIEESDAPFFTLYHPLKSKVPCIESCAHQNWDSSQMVLGWMRSWSWDSEVTRQFPGVRISGLSSISGISFIEQSGTHLLMFYWWLLSHSNSWVE